MKFTLRSGMLFIFFLAFALTAALFTSGVSAQDESWQITRAEYGTKNQHNDVTDLVKDLIARGGVNGRVAVTNQTMGGDPAVGKDKALRIFARNTKGQEHEFDYKEGGSIDARMFIVRAGDWGNGNANSGGQAQNAWSDLRIIRAFYGVQGKTVNVTDLLRNLVRNGSLSFVVTNSAMGGDPAVGSDKILIVVYSYQGTETAAAVREGNTLSLP